MLLQLLWSLLEVVIFHMGTSFLFTAVTQYWVTLMTTWLCNPSPIATADQQQLCVHRESLPFICMKQRYWNIHCNRYFYTRVQLYEPPPCYIYILYPSLVAKLRCSTCGLQPQTRKVHAHSPGWWVSKSRSQSTSCWCRQQKLHKPMLHLYRWFLSQAEWYQVHVTWDLSISLESGGSRKSPCNHTHRTYNGHISTSKKEFGCFHADPQVQCRSVRCIKPWT